MLARPAIPGPCPLFLINASTPGSGKTLLIDVIGALSLGADLPHQPFTDDDEEMRKRITSILSVGMQMVLLDNITGALGGDALDVVLTSRTWTDRRMGQNDSMIELPARTVWFASGNNIQVRGDLIRRVIPVYLMPDTERPEHRSGFTHADLLGHVKAHRAEYIGYALTILRAFVVAGRPTGPQPLGMFEDWSKLVRNALIWLGQPDPCIGMEQMRKDGDTRSNERAALIKGWFRAFDGEGMTLQEVGLRLQGYTPVANPTFEDKRDHLFAALREDPKLWGPGGVLLTKMLGYRMRSMKGQVFGGLKFIFEQDETANAARWSVIKLPPPEMAGDNRR